jgi:hypothetical protein
LLFIDDAFPLIITVSGPVFDADEVRAMADGFERYFARGERYAVLSASPRSAATPGQRERKLIADWAGHPRIRDFSKRLCVGTATVAQNPITRAALTVIMALWKQAAPVEIVPGVAAGLDYCLRRLREENVAMSKPFDLVRYEMLRRLEGLV